MSLTYPYDTPAIKAAQDKLSAAITEYLSVCPPLQKPKGEPVIEPVNKTCDASNFYLGYNMMLNAGHYMPGQIPVVVVPIRSCDVKKYRRKTTVSSLLKCLKIYP